MIIKRLNVLGAFVFVLIAGIVIFDVSFKLLFVGEGTDDDLNERKMNGQHQYESTKGGRYKAPVDPPSHSVRRRPHNAPIYPHRQNVPTKPQQPNKYSPYYNVMTQPQNAKRHDFRQNMILFYQVKWWEKSMLDSNDPFKQCSRRCEISFDKRDSARADVLIIQADLITNQALPAKTLNQIWVYSNFESPITSTAVGRPFVNKKVLDKFRRKFNWTMGYRRDADFTVTHGRFKVREEKSMEYLNSLDKLMKTKNKTAAWFVSHCPTSSGREKFGRMLQKYTHLDIYGICGKRLKNCNPNVRHHESFGFSKSGKKHGACMDFIDSEYKYFMAFENTLCLDYVTEKSLQRIMPHFIVPVARSNGNHTIYHPPGSIVDARHFRSAESLARFLNNVDIDQYKAFYSWRKDYIMEDMNNMWLENICRMCERSYEPERYRGLYDDVYRWLWKPNNQDACIKPWDM